MLLPTHFFVTLVLAMAITPQAKKAMRRDARKHVHNLRRKRAMKEAVKAVRDLATAGNIDAAQKKLPVAYKAIDKAAQKGVIKKRTAARKKSRLSNTLKNKK